MKRKGLVLFLAGFFCIGFVFCFTAQASSLIDSDAMFVGEAAGDISGASAAGAGDVNGDGYGDIIIGAPYADDGVSSSGKSYLIFGSESVSSGGLSSADFSFVGENENDRSGYTVANAGDIDGDGLSDILIFADGYEDGGVAVGRTYLVFGSTVNSAVSSGSSSMNLADADFSFTGEGYVSYGYTGYALSTLGDIDGDGYSEVLIGYYMMDNGYYTTGKTYLILSTTINADIASGITNIDLSSADFSFLDDESENCGGFSVCDAGDVDGNGMDDILIGGTLYPYTPIDHSAKVYLVMGETVSAKISSGDTSMPLSDSDCIFLAEQINDHCGRSVAGAGDVNGDGYSDILIGAYGYDSSGTAEGRSYLIFGSSTLSGNIDLADADCIFTGENSDDYSGWKVAGAGDVDADGYSDILINAEGNDDAYTDSGKTYLVLGRTINRLTSLGITDFALGSTNLQFTGENADDYSGGTTAGAGDIDGDGYSDILVCSTENDEGGSRAGKTYFISGSMISLVDNYKANSGTDGWLTAGTAGVVTEADGNECFSLPAYGDSLRQRISIPFGTRVMRINYKAKCDDSTVYAGLPYIEFGLVYGSGRVVTKSYSPVRAEEWRTVRRKLYIPLGVRYLDVYLKRSPDIWTGAANTAYFDDIVVMPG